MHHFVHHIGDYAEATSHLSILEDGVYSRLLRKYYARERPLPADVAEVQRLCVARSKAEKAAVVRILAEFFTLEDDGYHQDRADDTIAEYQEGEPDREQRKSNETSRNKRHRDDRKRMYELLRDAGVHLAFNAPISEVRAAVAQLPPAPAAAPATQAATAPATQAATAPATPATANQEPGTENRKPDSSPSASVPSETPPTPGEICKAMREAGLADMPNPSHARFLALLAIGATREEFVDTVRDLPGKSFAYVLAAVEGRRRDAAQAPAPQPRRRATSHNGLDDKDFSKGVTDDDSFA